MRVAWWGLGLVMMGCMRVGPGIPLTELPAGVSWCGSGPVAPAPMGPVRKADSTRLTGFSVLENCEPLLTAQVFSRSTWSGTIDFRVSSNAYGRVTEICVEGGNFGNPDDYISCVVRHVERLVTEPNLNNLRYRIVLVEDSD